MSYKNENIWQRLAAVLPGFKVIVEEEKEGDKKPCPTYVNWPTIGASLSPLRAGRAASLREIEAHLDAVEAKQEPKVVFDSQDLQRLVAKEIRSRKRARKPRHGRRSLVRDTHGYLW